MKPTIAVVPLILVAGCQQQPAHESNVVNQPAPAPEAPAANVAEPAPQANQAANVTLPDDRTPLPEPKGPIDPKSAEAAAQVVQHYGALIEQQRFAAAEQSWGSAEAAAAFTKKLKAQEEVHLEIGKPGDMEGAAGSIYVTVPVVFYGEKFRRAADVVLRRVNDVPGSTEAQRRWHIERIDWKAA